MTAETKNEKRDERAKRRLSNFVFRFSTLVSAIIIVFCFSAYVFASGEPDAFALPGVGARSGGMGSAFIGLSDDIESIYYNPAGLGNLIQSGVTAMFQPASLGTSRGFLGMNKRWVHPRLPGSVGFGWLRMSSSDIELTSEDERVLGSDDLSNDLFLLSAGVRPFSHWSFGASAKYFRFAFNGFSESGFGLDLGAHGQYNPFRMGFVLTDVGGTRLSGDSIDPAGGTVADVIPPRFKTGLGLFFSRPFNWPISLAWDVDTLFKLRGSQDIQTATGAEVWTFQDRFAIRGGYRESGGPTFGFGARFAQIQIDYSFLLSINLKDEHRIGTTFRF
jgi:hypothetical protein